jgi:hypothetical protein
MPYKTNSESSVVNEPRARWPADGAPRETPPIDRPRREDRSLACRQSAGGGAGRARTGDFRLAKAALSQLSYSPGAGVRMVGLSGFEPLTSRLSAVRSSQLSYRPVVPRQAESGSSAD